VFASNRCHWKHHSHVLWWLISYLSTYQILGAKCRKNQFCHLLCFQCHSVHFFELLIQAWYFYLIIDTCCEFCPSNYLLHCFHQGTNTGWYCWCFRDGLASLCWLCPPFTFSSWWLVHCFPHSRYQVDHLVVTRRLVLSCIWIVTFLRNLLELLIGWW
jgi:hypothetical protein